MNSYQIGESIELKARFRDHSGNPVSPTRVVLRVRDPRGDIETFEVAPAGTGLYVFIYSTLGRPEGVYDFLWQSTGTLEAVEEGSFQLVPTRIPIH